MGKAEETLPKSVEKTAQGVEKVRHSLKPLEVIKKFEMALKMFFRHCENLKNQYESVKKIKNNLSESQCLVHIDFSENYSTKYNA